MIIVIREAGKKYFLFVNQQTLFFDGFRKPAKKREKIRILSFTDGYCQGVVGSAIPNPARMKARST